MTETKIEDVEFEEGEELEVISFANRGLNMKGTFVSIDENQVNVTIELRNGTRTIFKKDNLQRVEE